MVSSYRLKPAVLISSYMCSIWNTEVLVSVQSCPSSYIKGISSRYRLPVMLRLLQEINSIILNHCGICVTDFWDRGLFATSPIVSSPKNTHPG